MGFIYEHTNNYLTVNTSKKTDLRYTMYKNKSKSYKKQKPQRLIGSLIKQQLYLDYAPPDYSVNSNSQGEFINSEYWGYFDDTDSFHNDIKSIFDELAYDYYSN